MMNSKFFQKRKFFTKHNIFFIIPTIVVNIVITVLITIFISIQYTRALTIEDFKDRETFMIDEFMSKVEHFFEYAKRKPMKTPYRAVLKQVKKTLNIYKKNWSTLNIKRLAEVLQVGETQFEIDFNIVLAIMWVESQYNINALNLNTNGTYDYGLCQINQINWNSLSKYSRSYLAKYDIKFSEDHYDIAMNVMNCFVYLNFTRAELKQHKIFSPQRWIQAYNTGISGCISSNENIIARRQAYHNKFFFALSKIKNVLTY